MSKSELKIENILQKSRIKYIKEKTFEDLRCGKLRFDFYLPKENIIIEFDGAQHFYQIKLFQKGRQDFLKYQEHDRQKNSYCLSHKIKLYRIPYWDLSDINTLNDICQDKYLVKTRWHNDDIWRRRSQQ